MLWPLFVECQPLNEGKDFFNRLGSSSNDKTQHSSTSIQLGVDGMIDDTDTKLRKKKTKNRETTSRFV